MVRRAPAKRRPRKAKPGTKGLAPGESILERLDGPTADAAAVVGNARAAPASSDDASAMVGEVTVEGSERLEALT